MQEQESNSPKPTTQTDDWSLLRIAVSNMSQWSVFENASLNYAIEIDGPHCQEEAQEVFKVVTELVPKLLDAYADLWEMSMAMTQAWEKLNESKNNLYVPDANEMVQSASLHHDETSPNKRSF